MSYITLDQVQALLNNTDPDDAADINWAINAATKYIDTYCRRSFARSTGIVEKIISRGNRFLLIERSPIVSVTSITFEGTTVPVSDYEIYDANAGVIFNLVEPWERSANNNGSRYVVTYTGGYILPGTSGRDLPEDIELAASLLVKEIFMTRMENASVRKKAIPQVVDIEYFAPIGRANGDSQAMIRARNILKPYRRGSVL